VALGGASFPPQSPLSRKNDPLSVDLTDPRQILEALCCHWPREQMERKRMDSAQKSPEGVFLPLTLGQ
jgi:hypothetical protein